MVIQEVAASEYRTRSTSADAGQRSGMEIERRKAISVENLSSPPPLG